MRGRYSSLAGSGGSSASAGVPTTDNAAIATHIIAVTAFLSLLVRINTEVDPSRSRYADNVVVQDMGRSELRRRLLHRNRCETRPAQTLSASALLQGGGSGHDRDGFGGGVRLRGDDPGAPAEPGDVDT